MGRRTARLRTRYARGSAVGCCRSWTRHPPRAASRGETPGSPSRCSGALTPPGTRTAPRPRGGRRTAPAGTVRGGKLLPGEILQERRQGPGENLIQIAVRNLVAQQVLRQLQLLIRLRPRGELHLVTLRRQRGHRRRPPRWRGG